jgi:hypothetical protein
MSKTNNIFAGLGLAVCALLLTLNFVEYRVEPTTVSRSAPDYILFPSDEIIPLGLTTLPPTPNSLLAKYHGRTMAQRGVFSRNRYPRSAAAIGGVLIPIGLLFLASRLLLRAFLVGTRSPKSKITGSV